MKKLNLICATLALAVGSITSAQAGIAGSAHDMSLQAWNVNKDLCGPCHMVHGGDPNNQLIPLWSHDNSATATWTPFESPYSTTIGTPSGVSLACLSCHDGSVAWNQLKGVDQSPAQYMSGSFLIGAGGDLRGDHPVSFIYNDAVNASPTNTLKLATEVLGSTTTAALNGKTVSQAFLKGTTKTVECASCHDVHRSVGDSATASAWPRSGAHNPLLVAYGLAQDGTGSALCRSCHNK